MARRKKPAVRKPVSRPHSPGDRSTGSRRAATVQEVAPPVASQRSRRGSWLGIPLFIFLAGSLTAFFVWNQVQIARVMLFGRPASAAVVAVDRCSRATSGHLRLTFTDSNGNTRTVTHSSYNMMCVGTYHAGETLTIRYVPDDPGVLMTQPEIDYLPVALFLFVLGDVIFLGGEAALLGYFVLLPVAARLSPTGRLTSAIERLYRRPY